MRLPVLTCLLLASCGGPAVPGATQDARITDPAVMAALNAPVMVDPGLAQSSNLDAIRPPSAPDPVAVPPDTLGERADPVDPATLRHAPPPAAACPQCRAAAGALTLEALVERQPGGATCAATIGYATGWAERLPAGLSPYPGARVVEAAGSDAAACALRMMALSTPATPERVLDWFYTRASAAGFSAEHGAADGVELLSGRRGEQEYLLRVTQRAGSGTEATLLTRGTD